MPIGLLIMEPLVSILIPAFNAQSFIADTIKSALGQTWRNKEIVIVDDGSTDQTLSIARQFASNNVCVVTQPNQGAAAARNKAFSLSRGDYVQWLDADDLLAPDKIAKQMEVLKTASSKRTLLSAAWGRFLYRIRTTRFSSSPLWCDLSPREWLLRKMEHGVHMQTATWLVSRQLTEAAGPWDTQLLGDDDGEYFCRVLRVSDGIRFVPEAKTYYRMTGGSSLSYIGRSARKIEAQFLSCKLHLEYALSLGENDRTRAACLKYLQKYMLHFYPERPDIVAEMNRIAASLKGGLHPPVLSWKYAWIEKAFGWALAKRAQLQYNQLKWALLRACDKLLFQFEERTLRYRNVFSPGV
jgi:glycosyltransferase involved in cell wall biosynthesis